MGFVDWQQCNQNNVIMEKCIEMFLHLDLKDFFFYNVLFQIISPYTF